MPDESTTVDPLTDDTLSKFHRMRELARSNDRSPLEEDELDRLRAEFRTLREFEPVSATEFLSRPIPRPHWAVKNIWPQGAMAVIGGAPKNRKSSFGLELAISLATATPFLGLRDQFPTLAPSQPVLYVQVENSAGRVQRDLEEVLVARGLGYFEEEVVDHWGFLVDQNDLSSEVIEQDIIERKFSPFDEVDLSKLHVLSNVPLQLEDEAHQAWVRAYVRLYGIKYLFLDPLYMLTALDYEQKPQSIRPLLTFFTNLKSEDGCAVILTRHQTAKHTSGSAASRLLGATYIYGWYEAALFTTRVDSLFTLEADALRELGVYETYTLTGTSIGNWSFDPYAQSKTDSLGRRATKTSMREANVSKFADLLAEHPEWEPKDFADVLGVTTRTISNYRTALAARSTE